MKNKLTIAIIGCGAFANNFVELFKSHPYTEKVYVCDIIPEKAKKFSEMFGVEIIESFEEALKDSSINYIANFTRRHKHGEISINALKAGKNVYSAVPMASTVDECAVDSYVTRVACFGCKTDDHAFTKDGNPWGNEFINQYAFIELANGEWQWISPAAT